MAHLAHRPNQLLGPPPRLGPQPALRRRGQGLLPRLQAVRRQPAPAHAPPPCGTTPHTARDDPQSVYNLSRPPRLPHSWDRALNAPENVLWSKSNAGDILCFDNRRVLHGRSGFELAGGETRKLIGTYLRWDEIRSMARVKAARIFPDKLL